MPKLDHEAAHGRDRYTRHRALGAKVLEAIKHLDLSDPDAVDERGGQVTALIHAIVLLVEAEASHAKQHLIHRKLLNLYEATALVSLHGKDETTPKGRIN